MMPEFTAKQLLLYTLLAFVVGAISGAVVMFFVTVADVAEWKRRQVEQLTCGEHFERCVICADMLDERSGRKP